MELGGVLLAYVIDILLIALFGFTVYRAAKQGFVASVLSTAAWVLAVLVAGQLCTTVAEAVYYPAVNDKVTEIIAARMPDLSDASLAVDYANGVVENIPHFLLNYAENAGIDTQSLVKGFSDVDLTADSIASELAEKIAAPIILSIIKSIVFVLLGVVVFFVLKLVFKLINKFFKIPLIKKTNEILGAVLGIIKGIFIVGSISILIYIFASFSSDNWLTNAAEKSYIINWLASLNLFTGLLGV